MVFGHKAAPRIVSQLMDVVSSAMSDAGIEHVRYLDDFFIVGSTPERAWASAHAAAAILKRFGLALSPGKTEGPSQVLEFLGIIIDSVQKTLSISAARRQELLALLRGFRHRGFTSLTKLQSLLGKLNFASQVLPGARPFFRRMIDLTRGRSSGRVLLNKGFQADVTYWLRHLDAWNGRERWRAPRATPWVFASDASTSGFGYGLESAPAPLAATLPPHLQPGTIRMGLWSQHTGDAARQASSSNIQWGEFFAPLAAVVEYGEHLSNQHLVFVIDNESDVHILNRLRTRDPRLGKLLRAMCDTALRYNFSFTAVHRPGVQNDLMDWASRPERHAFTGNASDYTPPGPTHAPVTCACSTVCGVDRYPPLLHPISLSLLSSHCLRFGSEGRLARWSSSSNGWSTSPSLCTSRLARAPPTPATRSCS